MGHPVSLREFRQALDSILDSAAAENSGSRKMLEDEVNHVENLYNLITNNNTSNGASDLLATCDGFIHEWESSAKVSAAVQQLIALLNRPHIRSALVAVDDIANGRFSPQLPPVPFEVDDDDGVAVKIVRLVKRGSMSSGIGVTIKKDSHGRVVIARVLSESIAEKSACIQEGDKLLESVVGMDPSEIATLLNQSDWSSMSLKMQPADPTPPVPSSSNIHLRVLVDYDPSTDRNHPCPESGITLSRGDIVELLMCGDEFWWQVKRLGRGGLAGIGEKNEKENGEREKRNIGLIPSESLLLKRRAGSTVRKDKDGMNTLRSRSSKSSADPDEGPPYETVVRMPPSTRSSPRPILLIGAPGAGRNEIKRKLISAFPKRFSSTVPHTSRAPRPNETSGVEYVFVSRRHMEDMINRGEMMEFGEFKGNLYGTTLSAVHEASKRGIPLLTPHPLALRSLRTSLFAPIIFFIRPPARKEFVRTRDSSRSSRGRSSSSSRVFSDTDIDSILETSHAIHCVYGAFFDAQIVNGELDKAVGEISRLIEVYCTSPSWVPIAWATKEAEG